MSTSTSFLLYGATGYTGRLIAEAAVQAGLTPVLAGRPHPASQGALDALGAKLGCRVVTAALSDEAALDRALLDVPLVLHCAGPFSQTAAPMVDACLRTGRSYLDITGEIPVFEALRARSDEARARGVMLLPGVGFDVVPSDCLLAHVHRRLPTATKLSLTIASLGRVSHGTAATSVEILGHGGLVRQHGALVPVPLGRATRRIVVDGRERMATLFPWGDLATAWHSTGVRNLEVWFTFPPRMIRLMRLAGLCRPVLQHPAVVAFLQRRIPAGGPSQHARETGRSTLIAEASDDDGHVVRSTLRTREGYAHTVDAALLCVRRALGGNTPPGYQTPSSAYGPDLVLEAPGTTRVDEA